MCAQADKDVYCRTVFRVKKPETALKSTDWEMNYGIFIQLDSVPTIKMNQRQHNCPIYLYINLKM